MRILLDCGICPDLHNYEDVEAGFLIREATEDGKTQCKSITHHKWLLLTGKTISIVAYGIHPVLRSVNWNTLQSQLCI